MRQPMRVLRLVFIISAPSIIVNILATEAWYRAVPFFVLPCNLDFYYYQVKLITCGLCSKSNKRGPCFPQ